MKFTAYVVPRQGIRARTEAQSVGATEMLVAATC
jgi:hypothetical protein